MSSLSQMIAKDKDLASLMEQERACAYATVLLTEAMRVEGLSKADLARKMGKSKAYVTQLLDGTTNMTVRTIANALFHLNRRLAIGSVPLAHDDYVPSVNLEQLVGAGPD